MRERRAFLIPRLIRRRASPEGRGLTRRIGARSWDADVDCGCPRGRSDAARCHSDPFSLTLLSSTPAPLALPPLRLDWWADSTFVAVTQDTREAVTIVGNVLGPRISGLAVLQDATAGSGGILMATERDVLVAFRSTGSFNEPQLVLSSAEWINGVAAARDGRLWVESKTGDSLHVRQYSLQGRAASLDGEWVVGSGSMTVPFAEGAVGIRRRSPFGMARLEDGGATRVPIEMAVDSTYVLAAAVPVGCGRILATFVDLASTARAIRILAPEDGAVLRSAELDETMSFFAADTLSRRVFAFRGLARGGEILTYRY